MRVFELSTHVNAISRSDGRTATAAAAYRSGTLIACTYAGCEHDYSRKGGVAFSQILAPEGAPAWAADRGSLWNAAELVERNGARGKNAGAWKANAQTAREYMFSFPVELSAEGREIVALQVARRLVETGVAADINIHAPGREGDQRNWHCHILVSTRLLGPEGFGKKAEWQTNKRKSQALAKEIRAFIAGAANAQLAAEGKGHLVHVEHRSFKARGITRPPQKHAGPARTNAQRRTMRQEREEWQREASEAQRSRHLSENKALRETQNAAWRASSQGWAEKTRDEVRRIVEQARQARRDDQPASGVRGFLLRITGRAKRAEEARQARAAERLAAVRREVNALRGRIEAEKAAVRAAQKQARERVKERQTGEVLQLTKAFEARAGKDLATERSLRTAWDRQQGLEQEIADLGRSRQLDL